MNKKETFIEKQNKFLEAITIGDKIISDSKTIDIKSKTSFIEYSILIRKSIENEKLNSAGLKSLIDSFLIYWNESISLESEIFWNELKKNNIEFERKEPIRFALAKGRFLNVHQGMDARKNWDKLKDSNFLKERYSSLEIKKIQEIIEIDEATRLSLIKSCLAKEKIPQNQYLRFGASIAYFNNCTLFAKYFSNDEVDKLVRIWEGFKSK